ncbi:uncharacterized protein LOC128678497 [Plodia interpunctella]|uniref:uncharacterized protein LOC128678497 n=1 Tax=Plodia interpunctella TaxID=58824 RepID=UPI0023675089|nr:uncharacterized protein LOC128678497 [Plodia interpunctella]
MFNRKINDFNRHKSIGDHYKLLLFILIICGFNYDYFKFKKIFKFIINGYCIVLNIAIVMASVSCCDDQDVPQIWSLFEYVASTIIVLYIKNKTSIFFLKLKNIDNSLRINRKYYLHTKYRLYLLIFTIWSVRIVYTTFYCVYYDYCYNDLLLYLLNQFSLIALDLNRVWRFAIYNEIRYRLRILRMRLGECPELSCYLFVINNKIRKENKVRFCLDLYQNIADTMDLMIPELHASLFVSVICSLPKLVINVYRVLLVIENHKPYESLGFMLMHILQISFFLFSPCTVAELFSYEIEKMRKILMDKMIKETDKTSKADIQLFVDYTHERNFRFKIWRIIPVNLSLPLNLVNLCTTYVIVVINFTHLYD